MENVWFQSALWLGLALLASLVSIRVGLSVALVEIIVGALAGNAVALELTAWVNYLAGVGAVVLTFLAGAEIDPEVVKRHFWSSTLLGLAGFALPFVGVTLFARFVLAWPWPQAAIAGISLSTTSVAVVFAVLVETGYNRSELGKVILAACFINDVGTVVALGAIFANYDLLLGLFLAATAIAMWLIPKFAPWFFAKVGPRLSEPETKFVLVLLFLLGGLASLAKSEPVLPAYLIGMALARFFLKEKTLAHRLRVMAFTLLTPFYFLKAGSLIKFSTVAAAAGLIAVFLLAKMATKFLGCWPLCHVFKFGRKEAMYTTLLMCTGLTFGSICALFGLQHGLIDQDQYTILLTAVIASAVVPTIIAQRWFQPNLAPVEEEAHV